MSTEKTIKETFNEAMSLIDHILTSEEYSDEEKKTQNIFKAIENKFKYDLDIEKMFVMFSDKTLRGYINSRRNYLAINYVQDHAYFNNESLASVANKFGYYDQPSMSKAIKNEFGIAPKTASIKHTPTIHFSDNKMSFDELFGVNSNRIRTVKEEAFDLFAGGDYSQKAANYYLEWLEEIDYYKKKYGFDEKNADLIATIAKNMDIPMDTAFESLHSIWIETQNNKANSNCCTNTKFDTEYPLSEEDIKTIKEKYDYEEYEIDDYVFVAYDKDLTPGQVYNICDKENCFPFDITNEMIEKYKGVK